MIVRLRNGAIGHVEQGARIAGDLWHRDFLFAKGRGAGNWESSSASLSIGFHLEVSETLRRQLPVGVDRYSVEGNLRGGARYLRQQLDTFGQHHLALAAYNAGPGRVRGGLVPRIRETQDYVSNVLSNWSRLSGLQRQTVILPADGAALQAPSRPSVRQRTADISTF